MEEQVNFFFLIFSDSHAVPPLAQTLLGLGYTNNAETMEQSRKPSQQNFISNVSSKDEKQGSKE